MAELVVKVPEKLKERMSKVSWIDWSSVAAKAISERLEDTEEVLKELKSGKIRPMTSEEFNKWCEEL